MLPSADGLDVTGQLHGPNLHLVPVGLLLDRIALEGLLVELRHVVQRTIEARCPPCDKQEQQGKHPKDGSKRSSHSQQLLLKALSPGVRCYNGRMLRVARRLSPKRAQDATHEQDTVLV